jgi:cbb3-type cytochrome oxidase subunit 3
LLVTYFAYQAQAQRAILRDNVTLFTEPGRHGLIPDAWALDTPSGLIALNRLVNNHAELIAYIIDFRALAAVIVCCIPVILIMNNPHRKTASAAA